MVIYIFISVKLNVFIYTKEELLEMLSGMLSVLVAAARDQTYEEALKEMMERIKSGTALKATDIEVFDCDYTVVHCHMRHIVSDFISPHPSLLRFSFIPLHTHVNSSYCHSTVLVAYSFRLYKLTCSFPPQTAGTSFNAWTYPAV